MAEPQILKSREYETIYILRPDVDADTADKVQGRVAEVVARETGKLVKVEAWGRRRLAYPVAKQKRGIYIYVKYIGRGGLVAEVERNLKLQDSVMKVQTVQTNEDVDMAAITVDPAEIKFERLEIPAEAEQEESREKALGLIELPPEERKMRERVEEDFADAEVPGEAEAEEAAPVAAAKDGEEEAN